MKNLVLAILGIFVIPYTAFAQSPFDGAWKMDVRSMQFITQKPDVILLQDGIYECKSCAPAIRVRADGRDHPVKVEVSSYVDTINIKIVDSRTIEEVDKWKGKTVAVERSKVSPDGQNLTVKMVYVDASKGNPVTGEEEEKRVVAGPAGSHAVSGTWQVLKFAHVSANELTSKFELRGNQLHFSSPAGLSYTAKLDGPEAPYYGDPEYSSVSLRRLSVNEIEETYRKGRKIVAVARVSISGDGRTMSIVYEDKVNGTSHHILAHKQQ